MKVNKKVVLSTGIVVGAIALIAGGTIAYFTDSDTATNNFTVGDVEVKLYESQLHRVNANVGVYFNSDIAAASADDFHICVPYLKDNVEVVNPYCTPNIAVSSNLSDVSAWQNGHVRAQNVAGQQGSGQRGVYSDTQIIADSESTAEATATNPGGYADYVADEYANLVPGKQVRKFVYVKNTGENPVYARVKVTIPAEVANLVTVKAPHTPQETSTPAGNNNINGVAMNYAYVTETDSTDAAGNKIMTFVFTDALKKNEMTYWSPITTVKINETATEADFANLTAENQFGITVDVEAIQSEGFTSAADAFNHYN
ncbi:hypothetical protein IJI91_00915 [Candidatus Saccharibacteria bacterium]|nr:hypothetical protein [Candidatus Saccharibacteria bacterium]